MKNTLNILLFLLAGTLVSDNCDAFRHRTIFKSTTQQQHAQQQQQPVRQQQQQTLIEFEKDDIDKILDGTLHVSGDVHLRAEDLFAGLDAFPERDSCRIAIDEIKEGCDKIVIDAAVDKLKTLVNSNVSAYQEMFELFLSKYLCMQNYPEMMQYCYMMSVIKAKYPNTDKGAACFDLNKFEDVRKIITEKNIRDIYSESKNNDEDVAFEKSAIESGILEIK